MATEKRLDLIGNNFEEIRKAFQQEDVLDTQLVAWGNRLYYSKGSLKGRFITVFQNIVSLFQKGYRLQNMRKALFATHQLYAQELKDFESHAEQIKQELLKLKKDSGSTLDKEFAWLENFSKKTEPFIKLCKRKEKKITTLFCALNLETVPFYRPDIHQKHRQLKSVKHLLKLSSGKVPFEVFRKLQNNEPLDTSEAEAQVQWEKKIKERMKELPHQEKLRRLPKSLQDVFGLLKPVSATATKESKLIETLFRDLNLKTLEDRDEKQIAFRDEILKKVTSNPPIPVVISDPEQKLEVVVGKPISSQFVSPHKKLTDTDLIFEIESDDSHVLLIPQNTFTLSLRSENRLKEHLIRPAAYEKIDSKGRFAIVEKLKSFKGNYDALIKWVKECVETKKGVTNFKPEYIMLDQNGNLASVKECLKASYDFMVLEEFIFVLSGNDYSRYKELIEKTEMGKREMMNIFSQMILQGLNAGFEEACENSTQNIKLAKQHIPSDHENSKAANTAWPFS